MIKGLGSNPDGSYSFLDIITLISFIIGLQNLDLNITQDDFQNATAQLDKEVNDGINKVLQEIHSHLEEQDKKMDEILERLEEKS